MIRNITNISNKDLSIRLNHLKASIRRQVKRKEQLLEQAKKENIDVAEEINSIEYSLVRVEMELCWAEREEEHRQISKEIDDAYQENLIKEREELNRLIKEDEKRLPDFNWSDFNNEVPKELRSKLKDFDKFYN